MRRPLLALSSALLSVLLVAGAVAAGGWAQVTVVDPPSEPVAGGTTTIDLQVMQHGQTAVSWPNLTVVATNDGSGATVRADATAEGAAGHYVASLTFPTEGEWELSFESTDLEMSGSATLRVGPAAAGAGSTGGTDANPTGTGSSIHPVAWLALAGLVALAAGLVIARLRGRRTAAMPS